MQYSLCVKVLAGCWGCLQELKQHQKADRQEIERLRGLFSKTVSVVWQIFGPLACR
jgi:hypothetical protein